MPHRATQKTALLLSLFRTFCRIGPATFGGGYAMIPLIEREALAKGWVPEEEMSDLLSLASSAPGGVGVNAAAIIGYRLAGIPGAISAVAGITLPTFFIVFMLSMAYAVFKDNEKVAAAVKGIQGAIIALIALAAYRMAKTALFDVSTVVIAVGTIAVLLLTNISPVYIILIGLFIGIALTQLKRRLGLEIHTEKKAAPKEDMHYPEYYI